MHNPEQIRVDIEVFLRNVQGRLFELGITDEFCDSLIAKIESGRRHEIKQSDIDTLFERVQSKAHLMLPPDGN